MTIYDAKKILICAILLAIVETSLNITITPLWKSCVFKVVAMCCGAWISKDKV